MTLLDTRRKLLWVGLLLLIFLLALLSPLSASPGDYFRITVVDDATGRGVPLVELRAVSEARYYTDSNGGRRH